MAQHLVVASLLHVQDLALQRKNRLELAVAPLLRGSACALTLDEVKLATIWLALRAVRKLARQSAAIQRSFAPRQVTSLTRSLARTCCVNRLIDDLLRDRRVLLQESTQPLVDERLYRTGD